MHHKKTMGCHQLTYKKSHFTLGVLYGKQVSGKEKRRDNYTFGFNGKEKLNEVYGTGNAYDFGARMYDPRIGRWMSADPLEGKYPSFSPYNFAMNTPLQANDPDGKEVIVVVQKVTTPDDVGHTLIAVSTYEEVQVEINGVATTMYRQTGYVTMDCYPKKGVRVGDKENPVSQQSLLDNSGIAAYAILDKDKNGVSGKDLQAKGATSDKPLLDDAMYFTFDQVKSEKKILEYSERQRDLKTPFDWKSFNCSNFVVNCLLKVSKLDIGVGFGTVNATADGLGPEIAGPCKVFNDLINLTNGAGKKILTKDVDYKINPAYEKDLTDPGTIEKNIQDWYDRKKPQ